MFSAGRKTCFPLIHMQLLKVMQLSNSSVCNLTVLLAVPGTGEVKHACVHAMVACGGVEVLLTYLLHGAESFLRS